MQVVIDVELKGVSDLLQNNWEGSEVQMLSKGKRKTSGTCNVEGEWKGKLYRTSDGKLGHPTAAIENAIVKAARDFKADKRRSMAEVIKACVFANETMAELVGKDEPDMVHRCSVVNPNTKGRGFRYRPLFSKGWEARFSLTISDSELVEVERVKEILDHAGARIGIGDWRPKFGRFYVKSFSERA